MNYGLCFIVLLTLFAAPAFGGESRWFLISREGECLELEKLARHENLPRTPATPEEFAEMMRARGYRVTVGLPDGFTAEFSGKVVQVKVRDNMAPIFVRKEICDQKEK